MLEIGSTGYLVTSKVSFSVHVGSRNITHLAGPSTLVSWPTQKKRLREQSLFTAGADNANMKIM